MPDVTRSHSFAARQKCLPLGSAQSPDGVLESIVFRFENLMVFFSVLLLTGKNDGEFILGTRREEVNCTKSVLSVDIQDCLKFIGAGAHHFIL